MYFGLFVDDVSPDVVAQNLYCAGDTAAQVCSRDMKTRVMVTIGYTKQNVADITFKITFF